MFIRRFAGILLTLLIWSDAALGAERQRSVVLIVIDTLRPDHLQTYGSPRATSPELLRFSRNATVFTHAYANAPWTHPSILSLMTGLYPAEFTASNGGGHQLIDGTPTFATVLRSWGYRTGGFYNTAQLTPKLTNLQKGFDTYVDYGGTAGLDLTKGFVDRGVDHVIQFLDSSKKPTFAFLHLLDPHAPYLPDRNLFGKTPRDRYKDPWALVHERLPYERGKISQCLLAKDLSIAGELQELYDSSIHDVDRELGRLFKFLETDPRYKDALVIVTSDHGEEFGEHGGWYHGRMYEESLRVPLIIRDPARSHAKGRRVNALVSLVDVFPTALQSLGISHNMRELSGKSLIEYFTRRGGLPRTTVYFDKPGCQYDPINAVRHGNWKMIIYRTHGIAKIELFNLADDPTEQKDLSGSKDPAIKTAMSTILTRYSEWHRLVSRPSPLRAGGESPPIPPELLERLRALGYIH